MKILFFSYAYPNPINPGLGTFNRTMIAGLATEHEVRVVSPVPFTDVMRAWSKGKLPRGLNDPTFQAVPSVPATYCTWYYSPKLFRNQYGQFMRRSVGSTLNHVLRDFQPHIVVSYWTHPDGEVAVNAAHQHGVRALMIVGGSDVLINARDGSRRQAILNVLQNADGIMTVSDNIKQVLVADGIPAGKLHLVRRGTDRRVFHEGDQNLARRSLGLPMTPPIIISVGRLVDVKGHTHLIEACKLLSERGANFRAYVLGDGPLRPALQRQIERHGLSDQVELRGAQTAAQLSIWYRAADLSVLPSLSEGVPNVLLESIASGTPFVASNVGGVPEIADPSFDRLVSAANPCELANAISERLTNVTTLVRKCRRFRPPTMSESAEALSLVLQSVRTGQPVSKAAELYMHETTSDSTTSDIPSPSSRNSADEDLFKTDEINVTASVEDHFNDDDEDLDRTAEFVRSRGDLQPSSWTSS